MEGWITIQLTDRGESILNDEPAIIENFIKKIVTSDFFLPVYYNKSRAYDNKIFLFTGYVFIKYDRLDSKNYLKLVNTQYFIGPLLVSKKLHLTPNYEIDKLKKELEKLIQPKIKIGDTVTVIDGKYKNLTAEVTDFNPDTKEADLMVTLKCMSILVPQVPSSCLLKINSDNSEKEEKKHSLQKRILSILKNHPKGLTRKDIISKMNLEDGELKRVSTILSRALKKSLIECFMSESGKSVFIFKK